MTKKINLTRGKITVVDDEDYVWASELNWYCDASGYARSFVSAGKYLILHREILKPDQGMQVDHINGDRLDNRRSNLRICTRLENLHNKVRYSNNLSGYKGVRWFKRDKIWQARIRVNKKLLHLGYFHDVILAARAYDAAAIKYFGEFARINFPDE